MPDLNSSTTGQMLLLLVPNDDLIRDMAEVKQVSFVAYHVQLLTWLLVVAAAAILHPLHQLRQCWSLQLQNNGTQVMSTFSFTRVVIAKYGMGVPIYQY